MAGSITVSTINNDTGVFVSQNAMNGIAKAWVNYNGTTQTIRGSFNVSSVTRNALGDYTVNFTASMPNANYAATTGGRFSASYRGFSSIQAQNTGNVNILCHALIQANTLFYPYINSQDDHDIVTVSVFSS